MSILDQLLPWRSEEIDFDLPERSLDDLKQTTDILFIDDNEGFQVVDILRRSGWINTSSVRDISSLDSKEIRDAHIIFVDIHGVGKELDFEDEGLGLIPAVKDKYPYKKVVVYSAQSTGNRFHEGINKADAALEKNADPYKFQALVEEYSKEIFTVDECVSRLQKDLERHFGKRISEDKIERKIKRLAKTGNITEQGVQKEFGIQEAGSIASLLSLLLS